MWLLNPNKTKLILSVIVVFHNMRREAERTLYTLSTEYQKNISASEYEVIAIDSNSQYPLDNRIIGALGPQFRYLNVSWRHPSPCRAINQGIKQANAKYIMCIIDGARMLSPGIIAKTMLALNAYHNPFIYTLGMHLGPTIQNESMLNGYDQQAEDTLLKNTPWCNNGYSLFSIAAVAISSKEGFYSEITESNCFTMKKKTYHAIGGMDERFITPGGGFTNLDFFKRATECNQLTPVLLLGEATFHQYHGGVATNVPLPDHPWHTFAEEYQQIRGTPYQSHFRSPVYFGEIVDEARHLAIRKKN